MLGEEEKQKQQKKRQAKEKPFLGIFQIDIFGFADKNNIVRFGTQTFLKM